MRCGKAGVRMKGGDNSRRRRGSGGLQRLRWRDVEQSSLMIVRKI